ncbi:MAG: alpha-hydroxy-acid oxidizing protein [Treponema sp.]|nr:alpha-hydroxy-acid oxidizing protein [Treponema sp.]
MEQNRNPGDSNNITRKYFDSLLLEMRHIGSVIPDTSFTLYGEKFATPVMTAALSHLDKCHPEGMVELARGAKAANAVMWAGMGDESELERITATGAKTIKIIKPYADRDLVFHKIKHAEKCGCIAVGMDIDHAFNNRGEYDNVLGFPMTGVSQNEIRQFIAETKLPFIIKGILSVQDAMLCVKAGVKGIVVSHHHGIMDFAVPPLMVLPQIVKKLKNIIPVFVDCGVENGMDVFKAIALGADAVSAGRALMGPLADNGAPGAAAAINNMTRTLAGAMARTCSKSLADIKSDLVYNTWNRG